eukprot:11364919-Alexandrium_andersonii.AAC.1
MAHWCTLSPVSRPSTIAPLWGYRCPRSSTKPCALASRPSFPCWKIPSQASRRSTSIRVGPRVILSPSLRKASPSGT